MLLSLPVHHDVPPEANMMRMAWLSLVAALIAGCGSGGSSESTDGHGLDPAPPVTTATLSVSTGPVSDHTVINAVEFSVSLPAGVSVQVKSDGEVADGVFNSVGRDISQARYTPATATSQASLRVNIADVNGFTTGYLATISCKVASGTTALTPARFPVTGFAAWHSSNDSVTRLDGISYGVSVTTQ